MKLSHLSVFTALFLGSLACAHDPQVQFDPNASPSDEVSKLEADLGKALEAQVNVLAPNNYEKAKDKLKDAQEGVKDHDKAQDILEDVAESRAYLTKAQAAADAGRNAMSEVVQARELAVKEGAQEAFNDDFKKADNKLTALTEDIEKGDLDNTSSRRGELQAIYMNLELRAITRNALNAAQGKVNQAKRDEDAAKYAPRTLAIAEKTIKDTQAYIIANRHNKAEIQAMSEKANAEADHVLKIAKQVREGTTVTTEEGALKLEAEQQKVAQTQEQLKAAQDKLSTETAANASLTASQQKEAAFQAKFKEAQAKFSPNEAEVYRQGDTLLIRLKGLEFDNGKAQLKGDNFPLLAKVQDVIANFGGGQVVIEGHTDSRGTPAKNTKLSEERAAAVKSYLQSNVKEGEKVEFNAVGYGFQKPLATNKTEAGRAQNRRVDVVIHPQAM